MSSPILAEEMLEAVDMLYFHKVSEALERSRQLQGAAQQAAIEAQGISNAFLSVVKEKYKLTEHDSIAQSGQIMRSTIEVKSDG